MANNPINKGSKKSTNGGLLINIIPTIDVVIFPQMVIPLLVMDSKIIEGVLQANERNEDMLLIAARTKSENINGPVAIEDLFRVGTVAKIIRVMTLADSSIKVLVQGSWRADVGSIVATDSVLKAHATRREYTSEVSLEQKPVLETHMKEVLSLAEKLSRYMGPYGREFQLLSSQIQDPDRLVDFLLSQVSVSIDQSQALLEKRNIIEVLGLIEEILKNEILAEQSSGQNIDKQFEKIFPKDFFSRQRPGSHDQENEEFSEIEALKLKIEKLALSKEAREEAERQVRRLERTSADSLESSVIRNHLDWLLSLPWGIYTKDSYDIESTSRTLNQDHFGMHDAKERILDFLSVKNFQNNHSSPILCFYGPPGVGKTSLAQSIAKATNRKFQRIALGGISDESEIRGHRRTYVGALPGRIIQSMKKCESMNPILLLDEIDKVGASGKGDPSSALLEVLDQEQNNAFYDNYLGITFDLSQVMFIATANDISTIPGPLRDRMEFIELNGYTDEEKLSIAQNYLVSKIAKNYGLQDKNMKIDEDVLRCIISCYTRESGVRDLERTLQKLSSKFARGLLEKNVASEFTVGNIPNYLGMKKFTFDRIDRADRIGVANGLAWTCNGGELMQVESLLVPGSGNILLTGQLGDVMKESAHAAISYAKSNCDKFDIKPTLFKSHDLHIHLPAGAIPKDGPSAGITLLSSILSAYTGRAIDGKCAMTGELNLQGMLLPIGGVKEKLMAAKRYGVDYVILPEKNRADVEECIECCGGLQLFFMNQVNELLDKVLLRNVEKVS